MVQQILDIFPVYTAKSSPAYAPPQELWSLYSCYLLLLKFPGASEILLKIYYSLKNATLPAMQCNVVGNAILM